MVARHKVVYLVDGTILNMWATLDKEDNLLGFILLSEPVISRLLLVTPSSQMTSDALWFHFQRS